MTQHEPTGTPASAAHGGEADGRELAAAIAQHARRLGFDRCCIVPVDAAPVDAMPIDAAPHADFFDAWLEAGRAGEMGYLARHADKRRRPSLLAEAGAPPFRSMIVLAVNYYQFALPPARRDDPSRGVIASYAWGDDYHEIIRPLLYDLDGLIRRRTGRSTPGKCLVDTGPVLERDWAQVAGIGFTGKNCCTIDPAAGSWLLLATVLVPEGLPVSPPARGRAGCRSGARSPGRPARGWALWQLGVARRPSGACAARRHVRALYALPGRVPDARLCRPLSPGPAALHLLLDHRGAPTCAARAAPGLRQPHLWL